MLHSSAHEPWHPGSKQGNLDDAEVAYGFPTGNAILTPYSEAFLGEHSSTYGAGLRYQLDNSLDLDLSASHRQRSNGNNDNRLFLQLRSDL